MNKRSAVAAIALAAAIPLVSAAPAGAAPRPVLRHGIRSLLTPAVAPAPLSTSSSGGISVKVPSALTVFNKARAHVTPAVSLRKGVYKTLVSTRITAYSGGRKVVSGRSIYLRIGTYTEITAVQYRGYKYVTKHKPVTVRTYHPGGEPGGTACVVTAVTSSDPNTPNLDDILESANCTNAAYPKQTVRVTGDDLYDVDAAPYSVGQTVISGVVDFQGFYTSVTTSKAYQVKVWTGYKTYTTRKQTIRIKDGGYEKIWSGSGDGNLFFHAHAGWSWAYDIYCDDYGFFGVVMNYSDYSHTGSFGPNDAPYGESYDSGSYPWSGSVELDVFDANCTWALGVWSSKPL